MSDTVLFFAGFLVGLLIMIFVVGLFLLLVVSSSESKSQVDEFEKVPWKIVGGL